MDRLPLTLRLAWRNVWRNPRRTLLTSTSIGLGLAALLLTLGLVNGMRDRLVQTVTDAWLGDAQIHAPGYREAPDVEIWLPDADEVLARAQAHPGVQAASARVLASGMVAIGARSAPVQVAGVRFADERRVTRWDGQITGAWPAAPRAVLLGADLAETLEVEPGGPLVLTVADLQTGDLQSTRLQVSGLLRVGDPGIDRGMVVVDLDALRESLGVDGAHEIALRLAPGADLDMVVADLAAPGLDVAGWPTLAPMLEQMRQLQGIMLGVMVAIVAVILGLGILNTLTMSLVDRLREFGVMRALGTTPKRLAGLILTEAFCLSVVGLALGAAVVAPLHLHLASAGLNLTGVEVVGVTLHQALRPRLDAGVVVTTALGVALLTVLVAGITAVRAARIEPIEALRRS